MKLTVKIYVCCFILFVITSTINSLSAQKFLPDLNLINTIQNDTSSYYFKKIWIKSKDINSNDAYGYFDRAREKIQMGYIRQSIPDLQHLIAIDSSYSNGYTLLGYCWLKEDSLKLAQKNFQKALTLNDTVATNYYYLGQFYLVTRQLKNADSLFRLCIKHDPTSYLSYFGRANIAYLNGNLKAAEKLYKKVNKLAPDFDKAIFNQAILYLSINPTRTLHYLNKAIKVNPKFAIAYYFKGYVKMYLNNDLKSTLQDWNKAISIDSTNTLFRISRGFLFLSKNKYNKGIHDLNVAINSAKLKNYTSDFSKSPYTQHADDFFTQLITVNKFYDRFNKTEKEQLNNALGLFYNQKYTDADNMYNILLKEGTLKGLLYYLKGFNEEYQQNKKAAFNDYKKAVQQPVFPYEAFLRMGSVEMNMNFNSDAIHDLTTYINRFDNVQYAYRCRGICYEMVGKLDSALLDFNRFLKLDSTVSDIHFDRGNCYMLFGEYAQASKDFKFVLDHQSNIDMPTMVLLAKCKFKLGDTTNALQLINNTEANLHYLSSDAHFFRGKLYLYLKNYKSAIADFSTYLLYFTNSSEAYRFRGMAYLEDNDYEKALNDLNTAIEKNKKNVNAIYYRGMVYAKLKKFNLAYKDFKTAEDMGNPNAEQAIKDFIGDHVGGQTTNK